MQAMAQTARNDLYELIDTIPEQELPGVRRYLEYVRDSAVEEVDDELDDVEREALHASIVRGLDEVRAGLGRPAEEVLAELRQRHR